ncbi:DUF4345 domain-containing protein [Cellulomonas xylanilytica]|uniref:DUF4345 domain-containing protein n=1 Tax=Cellulomonas xylanilytica TaxID=233583 RepID=A0A510V4S6_9CELL|nr:DUF4345 domain-containing protein [Cellulomonas xylanilytica]GEK21874.1 hypothetical protein CXY01_23940 [Cellulomonas xylanilytica]
MVKALLVVAGAVAVVVGAAVLLTPVAFSASYGVVLGSDADALSERRAPGAGLLVIGGLLVAGAFVARLRFTALLAGTLVYLAYGLARVLSLVLDGRPTDGLLVAGVVELAIGAACLGALVRSVRTGATEVAYAR